MANVSLPMCNRCGMSLMLCACRGVPIGQDVSFCVDGAPPALQSADQKLATWVHLVQHNPRAAAFDAARFVADQKIQGLLLTFQRLRPRLAHMMLEYDLSAPDGQPLSTLLPGTTQQSLRQMAQDAVERFVSFDWSNMTTFDLLLINNAYQSSDPERFPLSDADLAKGLDVLNCLLTVNQLASEKLGYSLQL